MNELNIANKKTPKCADKFSCDNCSFLCSKKSEWIRHLSTDKHNNAKNANNCATGFCCDNCKHIFKHASSLSRHKKNCVVNDNISNEKPLDNTEPVINENLIELLIEEHKDFKNLIIELMKNNKDLQKQNQEFQEKMMEVCKNSNTTINNKNSHNNNKTFNMQIFLNEHCKDAMNIKDFADSFQLQISDLEKVGNLGYVDGISDIIIKKLNEMDVHKRPIHCSDTKRDTMYVHADNVWTKENSDHDQVRSLVQRITAKNIRLIPIWQDLYPQSRNNMHKLNDTYMSLTRQAMGGFGGTIPENESKIIKKIAKTVYIDKNM
jgi:hypothetical protein